MAIMKKTFLPLFALALLVSGVASDHPSDDHGSPCDDPLSSKHLSEAIDAAITSLLGTQDWVHNLRVSTGYTHAMDVYTCTPDSDKWKYPEADHAQGLLKRVLDSGELRVAGVQWSMPGAADYKTTPETPTGFWPEYVREIARKLSENYKREIKVKHVYYDNSALVGEAVAAAQDVEMSEPYYYIAGFLGTMPRIEAMHFSCVTAGTSSSFYTHKDSGITNMVQLYDAIKNGPSRTVGFIGKGNFDSVSSILPESTVPGYITTSSEIEAEVQAERYLAGYLSEGDVGDLSAPENFNIFSSGIISPRVILFREDERTCHPVSDGESDTDDKLIIATIVIGVIAMILSVLLAVLVVKERQGSPMFMPLLSDNPAYGGNNEMAKM